MRIYPPTITLHDAIVRVEARVEMQTPLPDLPKTLWFEFPRVYQDAISPCADGFVVALLLLAMATREPIEVCAPLSPHLLCGMEEYQRIFNIWLPKWFRLVPVRSAADAPEMVAPTGVGCFFSGGVDSFFSLHSHLPHNEPIPERRLTHTLFVHGFDIPLTEEQTFTTAAREYTRLMERLELQLITGRTNIRAWVARLDWGMAHGPALLGTGLMLSGLFSRLYIPSSQHYLETDPWGSDYRTDHLLSTKTLQFVHDGSSYSRAEKTLAIARWPEAYSHLRVCWEKPDGLRNCCRCSKCIRTMTMLEAAGTLSHFTTFPLPLSRWQTRLCPLAYYELDQVGWTATRVASLGRNDLAFDLRCAQQLSRLRSFAGKTKRRVFAWLAPS